MRSFWHRALAGHAFDVIGENPYLSLQADEQTKRVAGAPDSATRDPMAWLREHGLPTENPLWLKQAAKVSQALRAAGIRLGAALGMGTFGVAYPVVGMPDKAIKITGDPSEASAARRVLLARAQGTSIPGVVAFDDVVAVRGTRLFVVAQERLLPLLPEQMRMILGSQVELRAAGTTGRPDPRVLASRVSRDYAIPERDVRALLDVFPALRAVGVDWHDLHQGNVLRAADGSMKVIDLGASLSGPIPVPVAPRRAR